MLYKSFIKGNYKVSYPLNPITDKPIILENYLLKRFEELNSLNVKDDNFLLEVIFYSTLGFNELIEEEFYIKKSKTKKFDHSKHIYKISLKYKDKVKEVLKRAIYNKITVKNGLYVTEKEDIELLIDLNSFKNLDLYFGSTSIFEYTLPNKLSIKDLSKALNNNYENKELIFEQNFKIMPKL
jgi:hypothetical protein